MKFYIPPEKSYSVLRFVGLNLGVWPLRNSSKKLSILYDFLWLFYLFNYIIMFLPTLYGLYTNRKNLIALSYSCIDTFVFMEAMSILIYCKVNRLSIQVLFDIAEIQLTIPKEKIVKELAHFYAIVYLIMLFTNSVVIFMYIFLDRPETGNHELIMSAIYPFAINSSTFKMILYINQMIVLFHTSVLSNADGIAVFLVYSCTDMLKVLEHKYSNASEFSDLACCIQEHYRVLRYIKNINKVVRFIVLKTTISFMVYVFASGLYILNGTPTNQWFHQISIMILVYVRICLCAESADNMSSAGKDLEFTVYFTAWYNENSTFITAKQIIIQRCQKLPIISVSGIMSSLDRKYLGMIFYATTSYFMTLRTILGSK